MFTPTADYWASKLERIRRAVRETEEHAATLTVPNQIEAHRSQVKHYRIELAKNEERYRSWRNKRQNLERMSEMPSRSRN